MDHKQALVKGKDTILGKVKDNIKHGTVPQERTPARIKKGENYGISTIPNKP